jgi:hypothetical protein
MNFNTNFTTSYDPNGYVNTIQTPDYGQNPWTQIAQQQQGNLNAANTGAMGIPGMMQNNQSQIDAMNTYAAQSSQYPMFPAETTVQNNQQQSPQTPINLGAQARNPWALMGEANSR